jgi:4-diphosphocytidyl-2C-methyl-D-erythritol kinase
MIGAVVSRRLATLHELDTVYGTQDVYDLMEIAAVDDYNQKEFNKER